MDPEAEIRKVEQAFKKASFFDRTFSTPDPNMLTAWAEAISRYDFAASDLTAAVTAHYQGSARTITVADLIKTARGLRNDRIQRAKAANHHALDATARRLEGDPSAIRDVLPRGGMFAQARQHIEQCAEGCAPSGLLFNDHGVLGRCLHDGRVDVSDARALPVGWANPEHHNHIPVSGRHPNWKDPRA